MNKVIPHEGYDILSRWSEEGLINSLITQNVDGFHSASGHTDVAELHGTLKTWHCNECGKRYPSHLFGNGEQCDCGGFLRPSVVLFGEMLPESTLDFAEKELKKADLFIVLGSSLQVSPANYFPQVAKNNGAKLVIVNMEQTPLDDIADLVMHDRKIGDLLREINEQIINKISSEKILRVATEGGSLSIVKINRRHNTFYIVERNESILTEIMDNEDNETLKSLLKDTKQFSRFTEALQEIDQYPWINFYPKYVHADYKSEVQEAILVRTNGKDVPFKWHRILEL